MQERAIVTKPSINLVVNQASDILYDKLLLEKFENLSRRTSKKIIKINTFCLNLSFGLAKVDRGHDVVEKVTQVLKRCVIEKIFFNINEFSVSTINAALAACKRRDIRGPIKDYTRQRPYLEINLTLLAATKVNMKFLQNALKVSDEINFNLLCSVKKKYSSSFINLLRTFITTNKSWKTLTLDDDITISSSHLVTFSSTRKADLWWMIEYGSILRFSGTGFLFLYSPIYQNFLEKNVVIKLVLSDCDVIRWFSKNTSDKISYELDFDELLPMESFACVSTATKKVFSINHFNVNCQLVSIASTAAIELEGLFKLCLTQLSRNPSTTDIQYLARRRFDLRLLRELASTKVNIMVDYFTRVLKHDIT